MRTIWKDSEWEQSALAVHLIELSSFGYGYSCSPSYSELVFNGIFQSWIITVVDDPHQQRQKTFLDKTQCNCNCYHCSFFLQQEKVEELQSIIRQSAKERLWLERQISNGDSSREPSPLLLSGDLASEIKKKTEILNRLEDENNNLKTSVIQLQKAEAESLKLVG